MTNYFDFAPIRAHAEAWSNSVNILIQRVVQEPVRNQVQILAINDTTLGWQPKEEGVRPYPSLRLEMYEAQRLMDDLWMAGLRPSEGAGSAGAMAATERHLKDLQRLLFDDIRTKVQVFEPGVEGSGYLGGDEDAGTVTR